jgi:hypothetical protein
MRSRGRAILPDTQLNERISQAIRPGGRIDLDELVSTLRDVYPEYRRQKLTPFTRRVQGVLEQHSAGDSEQQQPQSLTPVRVIMHRTQNLHVYR